MNARNDRISSVCETKEAGHTFGEIEETRARFYARFLIDAKEMRHRRSVAQIMSPARVVASAHANLSHHFVRNAGVLDDKFQDEVALVVEGHIQNIEDQLQIFVFNQSSWS